jgi:hypothetical protein
MFAATVAGLSAWAFGQQVENYVIYPVVLREAPERERIAA